MTAVLLAGNQWSRPVRGAWIETIQNVSKLYPTKSRPVRGAWIETTDPGDYRLMMHVAPRAGRVD